MHLNVSIYNKNIYRSIYLYRNKSDWDENNWFNQNTGLRLQLELCEIFSFKVRRQFVLNYHSYSLKRSSSKIKSIQIRQLSPIWHHRYLELYLCALQFKFFNFSYLNPDNLFTFSPFSTERLKKEKEFFTIYDKNVVTKNYHNLTDNFIPFKFNKLLLN